MLSMHIAKTAVPPKLPPKPKHPKIQILMQGFDATLIRKDVAHVLKSQGENKTLEIENALLNSSSVQSKIVSFSVSSSSHLEEITIDNAFVVPNLNVRYHKIDINEIRSS